MEPSELLKILSQLVQGGATLADARATVSRLGLPADVAAAVDLFQKETGRIRTLRIPAVVRNQSSSGWYTGPKENHIFWPVLRRTLLDEGWGGDSVTGLDDASSKIVAHLAAPGTSSFRTRGLVLGYVQSGKTSNFTAVIAKAADVGYRLIVVLSGIHNSLRRQTQIRLERHLHGLNEHSWFLLTTRDGDFSNPGNANLLLSNTDMRLLCVVKKNATRLRRVIRWLQSANPAVLGTCPVLVIDDEADQASLNTSVDLERRSTINRSVLSILRQPRCAYIGYTATPFANVLADPDFPEELYPRDFIVDLGRPPAYYGPETIFGRERLLADDEDVDGLDMIRSVPEAQALLLQSETPAVTPALEDAIRYFLIATAARRVRAAAVPHSTMLVHTSMRTTAHASLAGPLRTLLADLAKQLDTDPHLLQELEQLWVREQERLPSDVLDEHPVAFEALAPLLRQVLADVRVVVDNYLSQDRLDYSSGPLTAIAIGGNTLSRGLTLEGLVVSFFVRSASAYDTLLQMGRWFGYRHGYADLPRIWMTDELRSYFYTLATVEQEIRHDIERYEKENITPIEFAVRIRRHPKLAITSALKMQHAMRCSISYESGRAQTILFSHRDPAWVAHNLEATRGLIRSLRMGGHEPKQTPAQSGRFLFGSVPVEHILGFLQDYAFHPDSHDLQANLLLGYVRGRNEAGDLLEWNVMVMGQAKATDLGTIDLGMPAPIALINRARIDIAQPHANIKALMSKVDRVADLGIASSEAQSLSEDQLQARRPAGVGLLLLYPIAKDSRPGAVTRGKTRRVPLAAVDHIIGVGLVFPKPQGDDTPQEYMCVDLSTARRELEETVDPDAVDVEGDAPAVSGQ